MPPSPRSATSSAGLSSCSGSQTASSVVSNEIERPTINLIQVPNSYLKLLKRETLKQLQINTKTTKITNIQYRLMEKFDEVTNWQILINTNWYPVMFVAQPGNAFNSWVCLYVCVGEALKPGDSDGKFEPVSIEDRLETNKFHSEVFANTGEVAKFYFKKPMLIFENLPRKRSLCENTTMVQYAEFGSQIESKVIYFYITTTNQEPGWTYRLENQLTVRGVFKQEPIAMSYPQRPKTTIVTQLKISFSNTQETLTQIYDKSYNRIRRILRRVRGKMIYGKWPWERRDVREQLNAMTAMRDSFKFAWIKPKTTTSLLLKTLNKLRLVEYKMGFLCDSVRVRCLPPLVSAIERFRFMAKTGVKFTTQQWSTLSYLILTISYKKSLAISQWFATHRDVNNVDPGSRDDDPKPSLSTIYRVGEASKPGPCFLHEEAATLRKLTTFKTYSGPEFYDVAMAATKILAEHDIVMAATADDFTLNVGLQQYKLITQMIPTIAHFFPPDMILFGTKDSMGQMPTKIDSKMFMAHYITSNYGKRNFIYRTPLTFGKGSQSSSLTTKTIPQMITTSSSSSSQSSSACPHPPPIKTNTTKTISSMTMVPCSSPATSISSSASPLNDDPLPIQPSVEMPRGTILNEVLLSKIVAAIRNMVKNGESDKEINSSAQQSATLQLSSSYNLKKADPGYCDHLPKYGLSAVAAYSIAAIHAARHVSARVFLSTPHDESTGVVSRGVSGDTPDDQLLNEASTPSGTTLWPHQRLFLKAKIWWKQNTNYQPTPSLQANRIIEATTLHSSPVNVLSDFHQWGQAQSIQPNFIMAFCPSWPQTLLLSAGLLVTSAILLRHPLKALCTLVPHSLVLTSTLLTHLTSGLLWSLDFCTKGLSQIVAYGVRSSSLLRTI